MRKTISTVLFAAILSASTSASAAVITTYFDSVEFFSATGATSATGPLPNLSPTTVTSLTVGSVTITSLSGTNALWFGAEGVTETDWTTRLPGPDLAVSGVEAIQVDVALPVSAFGFDFVEPENDPWINAPFVDSTFAVSLFAGSLLIGSFSFNAPNDVAAFIGVSSDTLFDRVTIVETIGEHENEFFGQFYTAIIPEPDIVKVFEFDVDGVLPSADPEIELFTFGATATEAEVYQISGGLLQQRSFSVNGNYSYSFPDASLTGGGLDPAKSLVMEARLRIINIQGVDGAFFQAFDGLYRYGPLFDASGVIYFNAQRQGPSIPAPDTSQFHTYRVTSPADSSQFDFFIDGVLAFSGSAASAPSYNGFEWGDGLSSAGNGADVDWDFVRFAQPSLPELPELACQGFMSPFDMPLTLKHNVKRAIPVWMQLIDADGFVITDQDIVAPPVINVTFMGTVYGEAPPDDADLLPLGEANEDNIFRYDPDTETWIYNLSTKQFTSAGSYTVTVTSGDGTEYTINGSGACSQTFVRLP